MNKNQSRLILGTVCCVLLGAVVLLASGYFRAEATSGDAAPATALLAHDTRFFDGFERLFPIYPEMADQWADDPDAARSFARHQGTLQGAYLILAIRAVGLDAGPMLGFDGKKVDAAFLAGTAWESNFLCNIGYGALEGILGPRFYRYSFDEACRIV